MTFIYAFIKLHNSEKLPCISTDILYQIGTPAARMKKVASNIVKKRSRELTAVFESFTPYVGMEGKIERIWITDIAADGNHLVRSSDVQYAKYSYIMSVISKLHCFYETKIPFLYSLLLLLLFFFLVQVGHTKGYIQVLVIGPESMLGTSAMVKITSVGRWSVFGEVLEILTENVTSRVNRDDRLSTCSDLNDTCCSKESEACACGLASSCGQADEKTASFTLDDKDRDGVRSQDLIGWLLRKRKNNSQRNGDNEVLELDEKRRLRDGVHEWVLVDKALLFGILLSLFTIVFVFLYLGYRDISYE